MSAWEIHCLLWAERFAAGGHKGTAEAARKVAELEAQARKAASK